MRKNLNAPPASEIEQMTGELLGDANDDTIKTFISLLENFKDERAEAAYHNVGVAQRAAFRRTLAFENAFSTFAGLPGIPAFEEEKEDAAAALPWNYDSRAEN